MKQEAELKSAFGRELRRRAPDFVTLMLGTAGAPDRELNGNGITTHWEFKHGTPAFASPGNQELCCMRLAAAAHCRYVIWWETSKGTDHRTLIVHPRQLHMRRDWLPQPEAYCDGFDMEWLVTQVLKAHNL